MQLKNYLILFLSVSLFSCNKTDDVNPDGEQPGGFTCGRHNFEHCDLVVETKRDNTVFTFEYDDQDRLKRELRDGSETMRYEYPNDNTIRQIITSGGEIEYTLNSKKLVTKFETSYSFSEYKGVTELFYNDDDILIKAEWGSTDPNNNTLTVDYDHNIVNCNSQSVKATQSGGGMPGSTQLGEFTFDNSRANNYPVTSFQEYITSPYATNANLLTNMKVESTGAKLDKQFEFDSKGRIIKETVVQKNSANDPEVTTVNTFKYMCD